MKKTKKSLQRKPVQVRSRQTRDSILKAAAHILLSKNGLLGLNSNAIAERAGVSIGSFYQYYPNKEAVMNELIEGRMAHLVRLLEESIQQDAETAKTSPRDFLKKLILRLLQEFKNDRLLAPLMFTHSHVIADPSRMAQVEKTLIPLMAGAIQTSIPKTRKKNLELAAFVILQSYRGIAAICSARQFRGIEIEALSEEITDLFWGYLT